MLRLSVPHLLCPACGYDVAQTLADGFRRCPECGKEIDEFSCGRTEENLPAGLRAAVYAAWPAPLVIPVLWALRAPVRLIAVAGALAVLMVFVVWLLVELRLQRRRAVRGALGATLAVVLLDAFAAALVGILWGVVVLMGR